MSPLQRNVLEKYGLTTTKEKIEINEIRMVLKYFAYIGDYLDGVKNHKKVYQDIVEVLSLKAGEIKIGNTQIFFEEFNLNEIGQQVPEWLLEMIRIEIEALDGIELSFEIRGINGIRLIAEERTKNGCKEMESFFPEIKLKSLFEKSELVAEKAIYDYLIKTISRLNKSEKRRKIGEEIQNFVWKELLYVIEREKSCKK